MACDDGRVQSGRWVAAGLTLLSGMSLVGACERTAGRTESQLPVGWHGERVFDCCTVSGPGDLQVVPRKGMSAGSDFVEFERAGLKLYLELAPREFDLSQSVDPDVRATADSIAQIRVDGQTALLLRQRSVRPAESVEGWVDVPSERDARKQLKIRAVCATKGDCNLAETIIRNIRFE